MFLNAESVSSFKLSKSPKTKNKKPITLPGPPTYNQS
jgi:hypothetical protein